MYCECALLASSPSTTTKSWTKIRARDTMCRAHLGICITKPSTPSSTCISRDKTFSRVPMFQPLSRVLASVFCSVCVSLALPFSTHTHAHTALSQQAATLGQSLQNEPARSMSQDVAREAFSLGTTKPNFRNLPVPSRLEPAAHRPHR